MAAIVNKAGLGTEALEYIEEHAELEALDWNTIPVQESDDPVLWTQFRVLLDIADLCKTMNFDKTLYSRVVAESGICN